jgi:hypothetical protein
MTRFQVQIRCVACGHRYRRVLSAPDEITLAELPDPPCPQCLVSAKRAAFDFAAGKAPAVGGSLVVRAVDTTAEIVMEDHGLTDLRSDVREGETAVKNPPHIQNQIDNFFARPRARGQRPTGTIMDMPTSQVIKAAVSGRFMTEDTGTNWAIPEMHQKKVRPKINFIAGDGVRPK